MNSPITTDNQLPDKVRANRLALTLTIHGVICLCVLTISILGMTDHTLYWPTGEKNNLLWRQIPLILTPVLCFLAAICLRALRHSAIAISSFALISILLYWGILTLSITENYMMRTIFPYCIEGLSQADLLEMKESGQPYYVGHFTSWFIIWLFMVWGHFRWIWSRAAIRTFTMAFKPLDH